MVVGSKLVRHHQKYRVSITSQDFDEPQTLEIAIRNSKKPSKVFNGPTFRNFNYSANRAIPESEIEVAQNVTLINGTSQIVELDVSSNYF